MQVAFALVRGHDVLQVRLCDKNMCDFCDVLFVYYIIIVYIWRCFDLFSIHYSCMLLGKFPNIHVIGNPLKHCVLIITTTSHNHNLSFVSDLLRSYKIFFDFIFNIRQVRLLFIYIAILYRIIYCRFYGKRSSTVFLMIQNISNGI